MDGSEEVAALFLAFVGDLLRGVIDLRIRERDCDCFVGVFGFGVRDGGGVDVAVAVACDFEEAVRGWDHEEAVGEVEEGWAVGEGCFFGGGDGHVA